MGWKIVCTFALAFEKCTFSWRHKKEFFERFYINRQVVQEAVCLAPYYIGGLTDWVKETNRQEIDNSGLPSFNKHQRTFVLGTETNYRASLLGGEVKNDILQWRV